MSAVLWPLTAAWAQYTDLTENQSYIRGCRQIKQGVTAIVYDNTDLASKPTTQIGTLFAGTQVNLTGVLRETGSYTAAQVYLEDGDLTTLQPVGWINAAQLTNCTSTTPTPPPTDLPFGEDTCFRPRTSLLVRAEPSESAAWTGMQFGPESAITPSTMPPTYRTSAGGREWLEAETYRGDFWVASSGAGGVGSNLTPVRCP
jgi:hypothetical protein